MDIAFGDMGDFVKIQDGGSIVYYPSSVLRDKTKLIRKIKEKRRIITSAEGDGKEIIIESTIELELYDKQKSLDVLTKVVGAINPDVIMGKMDEPIEDDVDAPATTEDILNDIRNRIGK